MLTLYDELFILSLHEDKCTVLNSVEEALEYGLPAALLAELALAGKLRMDEKRRVGLVEGAPAGEPFLEEATQPLSQAERPRKINYWIGALAEKPKKLRESLVERLVSEGVLLAEDKRPYWAIPSPFHPEQNVSTKYAIKEHLRKLVMSGGEVGEKEIALLSLMSGCHMLDVLFLKDELKIARRKVRELMVGEAMRSPNFQIVEEIQSGLESLCEDD